MKGPPPQRLDVGGGVLTLLKLRLLRAWSLPSAGTRGLLAAFPAAPQAPQMWLGRVCLVPAALLLSCQANGPGKHGPCLIHARRRPEQRRQLSV